VTGGDGSIKVNSRVRYFWFHFQDRPEYNASHINGVFYLEVSYTPATWEIGAMGREIESRQGKEWQLLKLHHMYLH
jgi:hypothetical protein